MIVDMIFKHIRVVQLHLKILSTLGFMDIDHVTAHNYIIDERKIMIHYSLKNIALMHIYLYLLYIKTIKNVSGIIFLSKLNNHIGFKQHSELRLGLN